MTDPFATEFENPTYAIWNDQPNSDDLEEFLSWFHTLTPTQQVCFPTQWLCIEVYNGGFHQYFSNSTGLHAPEAVSGFRVLGLDDIADIVLQAISVFGSEFPREREVREKFLDSFQGSDIAEWNPFNKMDDLFYDTMKIPGAPDLVEDDRFTLAVKAYVRRNL